ncbi:MAG: RIP metalloprotease RseP [Ignavibacteriales bacterium]|nr:RIP metalloprotease RseP [Ignavibacteriales bacterium]
MEILNMIFYTAITLGVLVFIHEFGHFITAKLTGMRVDRFSIGFPPRAFGKKIGDTDYCISWIPIGGYVKIAGMIDESMDTGFLNKEPQPWEFRSKPFWAKTLVISGGVIMNVLLAVFIFWGIHIVQGSYIAETTEVGHVFKNSVFDKSGLQNGDKILSINGDTVTHWEEVQNLLFVKNLGNDIDLKIDRNGQQFHINLPAQKGTGFSDSTQGLLVAHTSTVVDGVELNMPAGRIGLLPGDTLIGVGNEKVNQVEAVTAIRGNAAKNISIKWKRGEKIFFDTLTVTNEGRIGVRLSSRYTGPSKKIEYTIFQSLGVALKDIKESIYLFYLTFSKIFAGKTSVKDSLGGPIAIAQLATQSAEYGFSMFVWFMAQLSMSLAILNILPIPALDGGHLLMFVIEKVMGKEIPHKVKIVIQQAGFVILLLFMAFVIYNDITRF